MVDINRITKAAERQFKDRILASGFHDKESADNFVEGMGQCFREILGDAVRGALEEDRKGAPRGGGNSGGGSSSGPKGSEWYDSGDPFPFGKYGPPPKGDGRSFGEIPSSYLEWLMRQEWIDEWPGVVRYVNGESPPPKIAAEQKEEDEVPF